MNSFIWVHIESWSCGSLAPIRYVAIALRNSTKGEKPTARNFRFILLVFSLFTTINRLLNKNSTSEMPN
jgi:hypothetical protein